MSVIYFYDVYIVSRDLIVKLTSEQVTVTIKSNSQQIVNLSLNKPINTSDSTWTVNNVMIYTNYNYYYFKLQQSLINSYKIIIYLYL